MSASTSTLTKKEEYQDTTKKEEYQDTITTATCQTDSATNIFSLFTTLNFILT
jgi:hypothetical protein